MVHEAAHAKLLQGFLRQLYAQHEAPSFEQTSQLHDVSSTKDGETQGLSFARMVQERNRLAQEVLDIAQGPVDAPVLYGGGRSDNEIDRADEIVQEAKRKKAEEARRRQEKLQEKIQVTLCAACSGFRVHLSSCSCFSSVHPAGQQIRTSCAFSGLLQLHNPEQEPPKKSSKIVCR